MLQVGNDAELQMALDSAVGGDVLQLAPGDYTTSFNNRLFPGPDYVTVESADPANPAHWTTLSIVGASYLKIRLLDVSNDQTASGDTPLVNIQGGSHHIELDGNEVHGPIPPAGDEDNPANYTSYYGIRCGHPTGVEAFDVVMTNNYVHHVNQGYVLIGSDRVRLENETIDATGEDAIKIGRFDTLDILNVRHNGYTYPVAGAHPDVIQSQGDGDNLTIRGFYFPLQTGSMQGIELHTYTYNDALIEQNLMMLTGTGLNKRGSAGSNFVARNNTFLNTGAQHSDIIVVNGFTQYNIVGTNFNSSGETSNPNRKLHLDGSPSDQWYVGQHFQNAVVGAGVTLDDLTPIGLSDDPQWGAYVRWQELMSEQGPPPMADTYTLDTDGIHGTATVNPDGMWSYTHGGATLDPDSFRYQKMDDFSQTAIGTMTLTVNAPPISAPDGAAAVDVGGTVGGDLKLL